MGLDTEAVTIVGLKMLVKNLLLTEEEEEEEDFEEEKKKYIPEVKVEWGEMSSLGKYELYQEDVGDIQNPEYCYVCVYKGTKSGPRGYDEKEEVECPLTLEQLIQEREELRKFLIERNLDHDFDPNFGIYTLIYASW